MTTPGSAAAIETVFRIEYGRLVGGLARYVGDLSLAEDLAQDALVDAMRQWSDDGVPHNPGAWLMTVGKRKAVDMFRRNRNLAAKYGQLGSELSGLASGDVGGTDDEIEDDRLRLIFVACHPVLSVAARVALTLRLVGGLTTDEIARAYLQPEPTIAQRIVRAKKAIAKAQVPFEVPAGDDRGSRLGSVLEVVYLIFNEGYSASAGDDWLRSDLCAEALRLARLLAALAPRDAEVHGLLALLEIQSSRLRARLGPNGEPVLLLDQDRRRWDRLHINLGLAALARAARLDAVMGPYAVQAAIAACHARAFRADETDWRRIVELYGVLAITTPSPIIELNGAVALSFAAGPQAALVVVDGLCASGKLANYHLLHAVRGDLLARLDRHGEAAREFELAASLAQNVRERQLNVERAAASARRGC